MIYRVPLTFTPQPEGGYTVTSTALPELVTEGDTLTEAQENARDALAAVVELYADLGRPLPLMILHAAEADSIESNTLVEVG
ncbi:type II toxin-antitoxin system HicB family antitoxin [Zavarzinella formosa]|uniref:type II toxin-antitoxin system HicB family antitoxin n=1 Tax=Zavarzinella formosa TaxID=360055 RepID=UPI00031F397B|nr:type II toxin-antitoxin system HicB family antitoxin [Zavarzinella formosa]